MQKEYVVVGHFRFVDDTESAIGALQKRDEEFELYSPVPNHDLEERIYANKKRSPVRKFTLLGGLTGCLGGFLMTSWMSMDWPLRTSAKTILSYPAFVVVAYECTILLGAIFTLLSMFHFSRIPNLVHTPGFRPEFSEGTFGLVAKVTKDAVEAIKAEFEKCGAQKVEVQYVR